MKKIYLVFMSLVIAVMCLGLQSQSNFINLDLNYGSFKGFVLNYVKIKNEKPVLININKADIEELARLNGVGEKKSVKIIDYRNKYGSFASIDDLTNVNGIGEKLLDKFENRITLED